MGSKRLAGIMLPGKGSRTRDPFGARRSVAGSKIVPLGIWRPSASRAAQEPAGTFGPVAPAAQLALLPPGAAVVSKRFSAVSKLLKSPARYAAVGTLTLALTALVC